MVFAIGHAHAVRVAKQLVDSDKVIQRAPTLGRVLGTA
jgi:hypothetical protein